MSHTFSNQFLTVFVRILDRRTMLCLYNLRDEWFFWFNLIFCTLSKQLMCQADHMEGTFLEYWRHSEIVKIAMVNEQKMRDKMFSYICLGRLFSKYNACHHTNIKTKFKSPKPTKITELLEVESIIPSFISEYET